MAKTLDVYLHCELVGQPVDAAMLTKPVVSLNVVSPLIAGVPK